MHALALALVIATGGLEIDDGGSDCPNGAAVAEALRGVAGEGSAAQVRERLELRREAGGVHLRLTDSNGAALAERSLPAGDCAELARTAAVLVAAWRTEVAATAPRLELERPPPKRPSKISYELGAGVVGSLAASAFAAGGDGEAAVGRRNGRVLGRVAAFGMDLRSIAVGTQANAHARFTRAGLSAGPQVRFRPGRWLLDLHAEATFALLYLDAVGFLTNQRAFGFDLGRGAGARAAIHAGPVAPFLGVGVVGWLTGQSVQVSGRLGGTAVVPPIEVLLQAGIAFGNY